MANKEQNARMLDPNRFKIAQQNAVMPGGPQNNNPMNVTDFAAPPIESDSIYGDHRQAYPQMGTGVVNPQMVQPSGLMQFNPVGQGRNQQPYNMQMQPSPNTEEPMEGMRLGMDASQKGLFSSQFMGPVGSPALMPGAIDPTTPGQGVPLMPPLTQIDPPAPIKKGKK